MDGATASKRARAAWAYSGKAQRQLASDSGVGYDHLRAILSNDPPDDVRMETLWSIADAAGVPRTFMDHGFPNGDQGALEGDVRALQAQMDTVLRILSMRRGGGAGSEGSRREGPEDLPGSGGPGRRLQ